MANNFKVWVDSGSSAAIMNSTTFAEDSQRTNGFSSGSIISSQHVNSALRQSNLVIAALMDIINDSNLSLTSSVADVKTAWVNYFKLTPDNTVNDDVVKFTINGQTYNKTIDNVSNASNATNVNITTETSNNNVVKFKVGNGTGYNKTINDVANVTTTINGKNISDIFQSNGTTVKLAGNALHTILSNVSSTPWTFSDSYFRLINNSLLSRYIATLSGNYDLIIPQKVIEFEGDASNSSTQQVEIQLNEIVHDGAILEITGSVYDSTIFTMKIKYTPTYNSSHNEWRQQISFSRVGEVMSMGVNFYGAELQLANTDDAAYLRISKSYYKQLGDTPQNNSGTTHIYKVVRVVE